MEENNSVEVLNEQPVQQPIEQQPVAPQPVTPVKPSIPSEYEPVSIGAYIGYTLLFGIPCVGLIAALIIAFGGNKKISLKNYAKAYLIMLLIAVVITILVTVVFGVGIFSLFNSVSSNY